VALVIEAAAAAAGAITVAAAIVVIIAFIGTIADLAVRVKGDLDDKARQLDGIRLSTRLDRGGGVVSRRFLDHIIADWDNWANKPA